MATTRTTKSGRYGAAPDQPETSQPGKTQIELPALPTQDPLVRKPQNGGDESDSRTKGG